MTEERGKLMAPTRLTHRVLILDDDQATLTLERRMLERAGYLVIGALTPESAREAIERHQADLVLVDYRLNGAVSGLEFFRSLREAGHELPAILVTSFADEAKVIEALRAGVRDVVPKSGDYLEYLPQAVRRVFDQVWAERHVAESEALKRLVDRLRQETQTIESIHRIGRLVAGELDLRKLIQTVTDACTELSGARFGAFFYNQTDAKGDRYALYALSGMPLEAFSQFPMPRKTALFGPTFRGEGVVRVDDITMDPRFGQNPPYRGLPPGHVPVRSYLAVPVISRDAKVIGGLFFGHPDVGVFSARHEQIVEGVAAQAAVAIDNARLVEALRTSEARLRLATDATQIGTWDYNLETGELEWSARSRELFNVSAEERVTYELFIERLHPDDRERTNEMVRRALDPAGDGSYAIDYRVNGHPERWLRAAGKAHFANGRAVRFLGTLQDVTAERRSAEERERLLESERAARAESERASRLKDDFLATLSHELRTPLNAILGWSHLLRARPLDARQIADGLETIERNARVQAQIVDDLLEMSRIISGKLRLEMCRVDLAAVIDAAIGTIQPAAEAKGIRVVRTVDPEVAAIAADPARIQQVLWNLLSNAIKFTPRDGCVEIVLAQADGHVQISVRDTGIGIKPEFLPYLFDRFRQADASTTREHRGMGLGLSIVKNLVEMHGGTIVATSAGEHRGSTFVITLPLSAPRAAAGAADEARAPADAAPIDPARRAALRLDGLRVLVVDDEPDARELLLRILRDYEAEVRTAASAQESLAIVAHWRPHVIVSDIGMPRVDGYDLIRDIRRLPEDKGGRTPALALTAFARSEDRQRALLAGYQAHLAKPAQPAELITLVASLAGRLRPECD